jgi:hypothetical protein
LMKVFEIIEIFDTAGIFVEGCLPWLERNMKVLKSAIEIPVCNFKISVY